MVFILILAYWTSFSYYITVGYEPTISKGILYGILMDGKFVLIVDIFQQSMPPMEWKLYDLLADEECNMTLHWFNIT